MTAEETAMPPRLVPDVPLPATAYIPGVTPRPHEIVREPVSPPEPERWAECLPYLVGIDLFNHGYFWEAHEAWESLWHACGRKGPMATFLKGLIKLAAAGVKMRQGVPAGTRRHALRAAELWRSLGVEGMMGLDVKELIGFATAVAEGGGFDFVLLPKQPLAA